MADEISIGAKAIKEVQTLRAELVELSKDALAAGKSLSSISTPGALNTAGNNNAKAIAELDVLKTKYDALTQEIIDLNEKLKKLNETRANGKKLTADEIVQRQVERKAAIDTAKANSELIGSYDKLNLKHQQAVKNAQNLGATYGVTSKEFIKASAEANRLDNELKELDASLGKHQRNVGNYKSGFNALGNSINQLSREMPAFANSAQTGFMAISNNIPAFQDAITQMRAGGMSWRDIIKEMGGALFGLTGMISLATTALVLLGPKIIDWISGTEKQLSATDALTEAIRRQNNEIKNYNETITHQGVIAIENAKQRGASAKEIDDIERKSTEDQLRNLVTVRDALQRQYTLAKTLREDEAKGAKDFDGHLVTRIKNRKDFIEAQKLSGNEEFKILQDSLRKANQEVAKQGFVLSELVEKQQTKRFEESQKKTKKIKEDVTPKIKELENELKPMTTIIGQINEEIDRLTVDRIVSDESALPAINFQLEQLKKLKEQIQGTPIATGDIINTTEIKEAKVAVKELSEEMKNYLKTFSIDFAQNSGFTETFAILNDEIEGFGENFAVTFNAIAESAQEVFNFISNASQQNFEDEKERLQSQYDVALTYAGDNKAAQQKLAEDLEKSKKEIANREAKAKQQQAIFNIAIDTAQGIVSALASTPPNIILSAVIAGIGAAQIAMVSSQKIPQYWMGGTHDGGLMMVNDGQGANFRETIVTPDGKIMKPQGRNVIMDAPIGTEIYTHDQWNQELNNMLQGKGILMSLPQQNSGITKDDLEDVFVRTLGNQPQYHSNFNANGASSYIVKRGNITRINTNRSNGRGLKFN